MKYILISVIVRIFSLHMCPLSHTHTHTRTISHSPLCVIPSDLADTVVRSLLSLCSLCQNRLWTRLPRKCNTACLFLWLSGMIRNIIMIKLAGGEELSGRRRPWQKASKRLEYCQRVVNKLQERRGVRVCEFLRVCECLHAQVCVHVCAQMWVLLLAGVMSGHITAYCWVEWHAGLSADGRNKKKEKKKAFISMGLGPTCLMLR